MEIDKDILSWLAYTPASDINFIMQLREANIETCRAALKYKRISKTARKKIESKLRKLNKLCQ